MTNESLSSEELLNRLSELEKELENLKEDSSRVQTAFLSNISHEIRTPLNAIVGFANLVAEDRLSPEEKKELASYIRNSSDSLIELINNLIDVSLIQAGKLRLNPENCFTDRIIDSVIRKFLKTNSGFRISHHPCRDGYLLFRSDRNRLIQMLFNLLKFISQYASSGDIVIACQFPENNIQFEFIMTGNQLETARSEILNSLSGKKISVNHASSNMTLQSSLLMAEALGGEIAVDESWEGHWSLIFRLKTNEDDRQKSGKDLSNDHLQRNIAI